MPQYETKISESPENAAEDQGDEPARSGGDRPERARRARIKWRACGFDRMDRRGFVDGFEEVQITYVVPARRYVVSFHHEEKARTGTLDEAKARAEEHLEVWREVRRMIREREAAASARRAQDQWEREERRAQQIARLSTLGVPAREMFGVIVLTTEVVDDLLLRLGAPERSHGSLDT